MEGLNEIKEIQREEILESLKLINDKIEELKLEQSNLTKSISRIAVLHSKITKYCKREF